MEEYEGLRVMWPSRPVRGTQDPAGQIPIAPLRHNLQGKKLRDLPAFSRFLLLGFDYLVTTRGAEAATHFEAIGKPAPR